MSGPSLYVARLRGTTRLLMEANMQAIAEKTMSRKGRYDNPEEWRMKVYFDADVGYVYFPADWLKESAEEAAKKFKLGRDFSMGLAFNPDGALSPVYVQNGTGPEIIKSIDMFQEWNEPDSPGRTRIGIHVAQVRRPPKRGNYVTGYRPVFPKGWEAEFDLLVFNPTFTRERLREILQLSGAFFGLGGGRDKGFGRYEVLSLETKEVTI